MYANVVKTVFKSKPKWFICQNLLASMEPFNNLSASDWKDAQASQSGKILDVRTAGEFSDSYIKGAQNIDVNSPDFMEKIGALDKEVPYFVYCRSGMRSANAMNIMRQSGFNTVYNLEGGIMGWEAQNNEVEYGDDF